MNSIVQIRQISQYPDLDPVFPDDRAVLQRGGLGGAYGSASVANLVATALMLPDQNGNTLDLKLSPGQGLNWEGFPDARMWFGAVGDDRFFFGRDVVVPSLAATVGITVGGRMVATIDDVNAAAAHSVQSFNGRTGFVQLSEDDVKRAGAAPVRNAHFSGWITAPSLWDTRANDDTVATTNWVHRAIHDTGVSSFMGRTGCVTLTTADVNAAYAALDGTYPTAPTPALGDASNRIATTLFVDESLADLHLTISDEQLAILTSTYAPINSPNFTGIPAGPTANPGTNTGQLATTAFVHAAVTASTTGVASFNTRTGAVTLSAADISGAGGALLNSPAFVGGPTAPTAAPGTSNTVLATTAFVAAAVSASAAGVSSFNTRTGAVTLSLADVQATNVLNNTALTGVPTGPTAAPGTSTTQLATTAFVTASGVSSFNSRTGAVTLSSADVSAAGGALTASPAFTGTPTAPTPVTSDNSTTLATTAFVKAALGATGVTTFNGRAGAVTLTAADITGAGGALLAGPAFTGVPTAPTPATTDNSTTLATTAFVQSLLSGTSLGIPGWTAQLSGNQSNFNALGTLGSQIVISGSTTASNQFLNFRNHAQGPVAQILDNTSNSGLASANYPILKNNVSGSPAIVTVGGSDANRNLQLVPVGVGTVQAPTMAPGDNSTAVATTAFVAAAATAGIKSVKLQKFTAAGAFTYTPSAGMAYCIVEAVGGGGASGGITGAATANFGGSGGGGGAYSRKLLTAAQVGASLTGSVGAGGAGAAGAGGAGGDTTLGTFVTAKGGGGGALVSSTLLGGGGAGGSAASSVGDIVIAGMAGSVGGWVGTNTSQVVAAGGTGGGSQLGQSTLNPTLPTGGTTVAGVAGSLYGSGGAGAATSGSTSVLNGAAGASGIVIITEFCTQ